MTDRDFDLLLEEEIATLPPTDALVEDITPWRRAVGRILWGMALCGITFNFLLLDYILPAIGTMLMLLGFRTLRRENRWFLAGFIAAVLRAAFVMFADILSATIWRSAFYASPAVPWLTGWNLCLSVLPALCVWGGFRAVRNQAGVEKNSRGFWLVVYYLLLSALALAELDATLVALGMVVVYILLLRSLWKYSHDLEDAGYTVQASPVRLSDRTLTLLLAGITALGIACGYLFFDQYPMDWAPQEITGAEATEVKTELLELGFPEDILSDLTDADILACRGAARVHVESREHPVNDGRMVSIRDDEGNTSHQYVYDTYELRITQIAVEIPGEARQFVIIQHFLWLEDPGFRGTDAIQIWPASRQEDQGWLKTADYSGRVLYDQDGVSYASAYHFLGSITGTATSVFWENQISTDGIAAFSLPRGGENGRGYICYTVAEGDPGHILDGWFNYYYQESALQYPVQTAADAITPGWARNSDCYHCTATALQMAYDATKAQEEGVYDFYIIE